MAMAAPPWSRPRRGTKLCLREDDDAGLPQGTSGLLHFDRLRVKDLERFFLERDALAARGLAPLPLDSKTASIARRHEAEVAEIGDDRPLLAPVLSKRHCLAQD